MDESFEGVQRESEREEFSRSEREFDEVLMPKLPEKGWASRIMNNIIWGGKSIFAPDLGLSPDDPALREQKLPDGIKPNEAY